MAGREAKIRIKGVYSHPVGRDAIDKVLLQLGRSRGRVTNPLVANLPLGVLGRLARPVLGPGFAGSLLEVLAGHPEAAGPGATAPLVPGAGGPASGGQPWWRSAVFYQVYPLPSPTTTGTESATYAGSSPGWIIWLTSASTASGCRRSSTPRTKTWAMTYATTPSLTHTAAGHDSRPRSTGSRAPSRISCHLARGSAGSVQLCVAPTQNVSDIHRTAGVDAHYGCQRERCTTRGPVRPMGGDPLGILMDHVPAPAPIPG